MRGEGEGEGEGERVRVRVCLAVNCGRPVDSFPDSTAQLFRLFYYVRKKLGST